MIHNINTRADWAGFVAEYRGRGGVPNERVVAIDPDTKECGYFDVDLVSRMGDIGTLRAECFNPIPWDEGGETTLAVVESQRVFPGATQRTKSIVELARAAGVAAGSAVGDNGEIVFLDPCVWKGQIKKPTKIAQRFEYITHQRNMAKLPAKLKEAYVVALREAKSKGRDFQFEVMDAVGILLFTLEGLGVEL